MNQNRRLIGRPLEALEDRLVPTNLFGVPWADPDLVTLSFPADGTPTLPGPSELRATMDDGDSTNWKREVLRAYQTWAAHANINVGLVADGGQPLGTLGAAQGDARFGDVRIAAAPLSAGAVAYATPFNYTGTTLAGDLLFNSAKPFSTGGGAGYDVYSVALHEAGHSFGLDHSDAADSVLRENYTPHQGLGRGDVADIRALYGARVPDAFDAARVGGNDAIGRASWLPESPTGASQKYALGDLSSIGDIDYYKFNVPLLGGLVGVAVRVKAEGVSLLTPRVTVYNSSGRAITAAATTDPTNNDLIAYFHPGLIGALFGGTAYVKVDAPGQDVFGVGRYQLAVDFLSPTDLLKPIPALLSAVLDGGTNETLSTATGLDPRARPAPDGRFDYTHRGAIETRTDVDTFRVTAPAGTTPLNLNVMAWGVDQNPVDPRVRVYDRAGRPVAFQVLSNDAGIMSVQLTGLAPGVDYFVQVARRAGAGAETGRYVLAADFNTHRPMAFDPADELPLSAGAVTTAGLTVRESGVFEFALAAAGAGGGVTLTVFDAAGRAVTTLTAAGDDLMVTRVKYLTAGAYTVRYTAGPGAPVRANLFLLQLTDEVGPFATGTSEGGSSGSPPNGGYEYSGTSQPAGGYPYYF